MPMVVRYPPLFPSSPYKPGAICRSFTTVMDVMPTLLELAGVEHPNPRAKSSRDRAPFVTSSGEQREVYPMRGKSWIPWLQRGKAAIPFEQTTGKVDALGAPLAADADAIYGKDDPAVGWEMHGCASLRLGRWKIVHQTKSNFGTGEWELFDLVTDQGETRDLAAEQPERLAEMLKHWKTYEEETGAVLREPPVRGLIKPSKVAIADRVGGDPMSDQRVWINLNVGQAIA